MIRRGAEPNGLTIGSGLDTLLQRLDGVQPAGKGYRARCPACGGKSRKLSITQADNRILLHCFSCHDSEGVLAAIGLAWADLNPPRTWPPKPEERERARRAIRECGWSSALAVLPLEGTILHLAARMVSDGDPLTVEDGERLALACMRIDQSALILTDKPEWRPEDTYTPARLVAIKRAAATELRRELDAAETSLQGAELALRHFELARGAG